MDRVMEISNVLLRQVGLLLGVGERAEKGLNNPKIESAQDGIILVISEDKS